jgi:hypothetical protein
MAASAPTAKIDRNPMLYWQSKLQGHRRHRKAFEAMNIFLEDHPINPVIDGVYSFENSLDAFRQLENGAFEGLSFEWGIHERL